MAEDSLVGGLGKLVLGGAAGFALYLLVTGLGFGGRGRGEDRGEGEPITSPPRPAPQLPKDDVPLLFVVVHPDGWKEASKLPDPTSRARRDAVFRRIELGNAEVSIDALYMRMTDVLRRERDKETPPLLLDDVIARVKAGARDDVRLITTGGLRQGTWDDVKDALMLAEIKHWLEWHEWPSDRKPGDPPKRPRWDLYDKVDAVGNPNKTGHYLVENRGTAYWNLADPAPHVSGRGISVGRGYYRGYRR